MTLLHQAIADIKDNLLLFIIVMALAIWLAFGKDDNDSY